MLDDAASRGAYWDRFYSGKAVAAAAPQIPSQFAAFALNEFGDVDGIVEFGCGNGRDAHFFGRYGFGVLAFDACSQAIQRARDHQPAGAALRFVATPIEGAEAELRAFVGAHRSVGVYARFFLHSIRDDEQAHLLDLLRREMPSGSKLAFEYRTTGDEEVPKAFGEHFRRYLRQSELVEAVGAAGYRVTYAAEGRGFAKYKAEDAVVGRCIAVKI